MANLIFAGIGSRRAPPHVLDAMTQLAAWMSGRGWMLRSGAADGADSAFEAGIDQAGGRKEIWLPFPGYNGRYDNAGAEHLRIPYHYPTADFFLLAATLHVGWHSLKPAARRLMARNCGQILGPQEDQHTTDAVVCWTPDGCETEENRTRDTGGTGLAIALACRKGVPVFNLRQPDALERLQKFLGAPIPAAIWIILEQVPSEAIAPSPAAPSQQARQVAPAPHQALPSPAINTKMIPPHLRAKRAKEEGPATGSASNPAADTYEGARILGNPVSINTHPDGAAPAPGQIFVFGSNLAGRHGAGAALFAVKTCEAEPGCGHGPAGRSWAIPTKDGRNGQSLSDARAALLQPEIAGYIAQFLEHAHQNPQQQFFLTRVGCGLAGYDDAQIAPLFHGQHGILPNISYPEPWAAHLTLQQAQSTWKNVRKQIAPGINIWSGERGLGAMLTNPSDLARQKGNITQAFPIELPMGRYRDTEHAYQTLKTRGACYDEGANDELMERLVAVKFAQHPSLELEVQRRGGIAWFARCTHFVGHTSSMKPDAWGGRGFDSRFIRCLGRGYEINRLHHAQVRASFKDEGAWSDWIKTPAPTRRQRDLF